MIQVKVSLIKKHKISMILIEVKDNGIGIKYKDQGKLFKMFGFMKDTQKKINTDGIGLGLVISKMIVHKFNGQIDFISKYEQGSTFHFTFPICHIQSEELAMFLD